MHLFSGVGAAVHAHANVVQRFRMCTTRLAANTHSKLVDIERTCGVTGISVKRAVKQYRSGGG
jgi:hypothetical protein